MSPAARKSPLQWLANATSKVRQAERVRAKTKIEMLDSFENAGLGNFWSTDSHGNLDYLSREAIEAGEWKEEQVLGSPISQLFLHDNQAENAGARSLSFLLAARNAISGHIVRIESDFGDQWWELAGQPCFDDQGNFQGYRGSARDITSERQAKLRQDRRARSCSITGLANRSHILERLTEMLRVFRNTKQSCAILMIDLDRFKQVNELLGQGAGNELLRQAAGRISRIAGEKGSVARLGGDEYLVVLPDQDDRGVLGAYGQRLCQMLSQPYSIDGKQAEVGASVGIAVAPYDGVESNELLDAAEMALYAAKGTRKGTYRFYSNDLKLRAKERAGLEADLRGAEERGELKMFYQPIVDAGTYSLKCVEALIRWEHPRRGWVSPGEFIPIAEESGLIRKIGAWAIR